MKSATKISQYSSSVLLSENEAILVVSVSNPSVVDSEGEEALVVLAPNLLVLGSPGVWFSGES